MKFLSITREGKTKLVNMDKIVDIEPKQVEGRLWIGIRLDYGGTGFYPDEKEQTHTIEQMIQERIIKL